MYYQFCPGGKKNLPTYPTSKFWVGLGETEIFNDSLIRKKNTRVKSFLFANANLTVLKNFDWALHIWND